MRAQTRKKASVSTGDVHQTSPGIPTMLVRKIVQNTPLATETISPASSLTHARELDKVEELHHASVANFAKLVSGLYVFIYLNCQQRLWDGTLTGILLFCASRGRRRRSARRAAERKQAGGALRHCLNTFLDLLRCRCITMDALRSRERALGSRLLTASVSPDISPPYRHLCRLQVCFRTTGRTTAAASYFPSYF